MSKLHNTNEQTQKDLIFQGQILQGNLEENFRLRGELKTSNETIKTLEAMLHQLIYPQLLLI